MIYLLSSEYFSSNKSVPLDSNICTKSYKYVSLRPHVRICIGRSMGSRYSSVLQREEENPSGTRSINSLPSSCTVLPSGLVRSAHKLPLSLSLQIFIWFKRAGFFFPPTMGSDLTSLFVLCHHLSQAVFSLNPFCCSTI